MSIPPLVCSTPPPPDQCEDDRDPEDFELSYNLSQEDEDDDENNGYDYGNFSSYNNFQSTPDNKPLEIKQQEIIPTIENEVQKEVYLKYKDEKDTVHNNASHHVFGTNDINENKLKCEEDLSIEDLNLKVDEEIESVVERNTDQIEISESSVSNVKDFDIPSNSNNDNPSCDNTNVSSFDENTIDTADTLKDFNIPFEPAEVQANDEALVKNEPYDLNTETITQESVYSGPNKLDEPLVLQDTLINSECDTQPVDESTEDLKPNVEDNMLDDDFGDFDDFQSVNTISNVTNVVESSNNPWENVDSNESDFRNFTANFDDNKFENTEDLSPTESVSMSNNLDLCENVDNQPDNNLDDDDDFGDFDDFQSSSAKTESNEVPVEDSMHCQELPVLNLQSTESDHQIMESITKVLSSVFLEEISEPDSVFEGKLESLLSETWGHLMETDERQPYIVNWNNSLGQKTLLRALCIDSRNILFGPKWSSHMPKYAANLSNAPLQPQKQVSVPSSIVTQNEVVAEKPSSKPTTWTDPFTSDGQESCNTENESAAITPGPTDLDVFEAAIPSKSDKIYSNTMGVQPLRQINLPDTHIFTPTDSEIPRSKTIHYDRGPTVLLPQPAMIDNKNQSDAVTANTNSVENNLDDNEYWEFQNFKGTSDSSSLPGNISNSHIQTITIEKKFETATTVNALPQPSIAYQTELLQPIKVEPMMPALNWPDPGEVKGVFDDFSDFVSISSQPAEKQESSSTQPVDSHSETSSIQRWDNLSVPGDNTAVAPEVKTFDNDSFDDDFDTFQSALPPKSQSDQFKSGLENTTHSTSFNQVTEFNNGSPKVDSVKSDTISFASILRPNEALTQNVSYFSNTPELNNKSSLPSGTQLPTNLLQPTHSNFNSVNTQSQKSAQILQPLSLESYSQINWPSPGIDLQDLSRFNPVETLHSLKSDLSVSGLNKVASPVHVAKTTTANQATADDDGWGEFVSSKPKQQQAQPKKPSAFVDDDEWTDFISSTSVKSQNGLNTISLNVHTNSNMQKSVQNKFVKKSNQPPLDIPTLNYITPKTNPHKSYNDKHFQNL